MAAYHGKTAKINFNTSDIFKGQSWTLSTACDTADSTGMQDTWEEHVGGLTDFTAAVDGLAETTVDYCSLIATEATLNLYIDNTNYFTATAILTSCTETASIEGVGTISYTFEGDSATGLTYT